VRKVCGFRARHTLGCANCLFRASRLCRYVVPLRQCPRTNRGCLT
jgi:hypothetical protein